MMSVAQVRNGDYSHSIGGYRSHRRSGWAIGLWHEREVMEITVAFRCPEGCDEQRINFDSLDDLLCSLSESGWPICCECGQDTTHEIVSSNETARDMDVQRLIDELNKVKDKKQIVAGCVHGVEVGETLIVGVVSETPDEPHDPNEVGVCWLLFREDSSIHKV